VLQRHSFSYNNQDLTDSLVNFSGCRRYTILHHFVAVKQIGGDPQRSLTVPKLLELSTEPGAVEAVNRFENLVILEWHSITEPGVVTTGCCHSTNLSPVFYRKADPVPASTWKATHHQAKRL
jgi:hypothetical protein